MIKMITGIETLLKQILKPSRPESCANKLLAEQILGHLADLKRKLEKVDYLLDKIARSYSDDPGTSDLDDEQPVSLSITLKEVRLARQLHDYRRTVKIFQMQIVDHNILNNGWWHYFRMQRPAGDCFGITIDVRSQIIYRVDGLGGLTTSEMIDTMEMIQEVMAQYD